MPTGGKKKILVGTRMASTKEKRTTLDEDAKDAQEELFGKAAAGLDVEAQDEDRNTQSDRSNDHFLCDYVAWLKLIISILQIPHLVLHFSEMQHTLHNLQVTKYALEIGARHLTLQDHLILFRIISYRTIALRV